MTGAILARSRPSDGEAPVVTKAERPTSSDLIPVNSNQPLVLRLNNELLVLMEARYFPEAHVERVSTNFADSFFLRETPDYELRSGIMSVLAGDVWRDDNPFQEMLLRGRRRKTTRAETLN